MKTVLFVVFLVPLILFSNVASAQVDRSDRCDAIRPTKLCALVKRGFSTSCGSLYNVEVKLYRANGDLIDRQTIAYEVCADEAQKTLDSRACN